MFKDFYYLFAALYNFDTSVVNTDTLQSIYDAVSGLKYILISAAITC